METIELKKFGKKILPKLDEPTKVEALEIISTILSVYVLTMLVVDWFIHFSIPVSRTIMFIDHFICAFFFIEFCIRFNKAQNKWRFMRWGWIDLLSCIPSLEAYRYLRGFRLIKLLRAFRAYRSIKFLIEKHFPDSKGGSIVTLFLAQFLIIIFGAVAVLEFEKGVEGSSIQTAADALWWAVVTITTVGYGDKFPITIAGRCVAAALMITGVGIFGTYAALMGSWFTTQKETLTNKKLVGFIKWYQIHLYEESEGETVDSMSDAIEKYTPEELVALWGEETQQM